MSASHGLRFEGSRFWVIHRRREYGPFDYQWSKDLRGLEMTYRDHKFGEHCGAGEIFADLKEYGLPRSVVDVASIVIGCLLYGILHGLDEQQRERFLAEQLRQHGYERFVTNQ